MDFFLEMVLTAVVALFFSFVVAKLMSVASAGGRNGSGSESEEKPGLHVGEKLRFEQKMEARVLCSDRSVGIVEENVGHVDRFVGEDVRVDELEVAATGSGEFDDERGVLAVESSEADSAVAASPGNVVAETEEMVVRGEEEREAESIAADSPENLIGRHEERKADSAASVSRENVIAEEMVVRGQEEQNPKTSASVSPGNVIEEEMGAGGEEERKSESGDAVSPENVVVEETKVRGQEEGNESEKERSQDHLEIEESGNVEVAESEGIGVYENESIDGIQEKTEELNIEEEDDDWEGIEKSELEKAFAAAAKFMEESGDVLEMGNEEKTELYGLHKIATEGPCRDSPPMALMVSARSKWNAWQKLGNMSQEDAMERYLALLSKEIPGQVHAGSTFEKKPEMETFMGSAEQPSSLNTTDSKYEAEEDDIK